MDQNQGKEIAISNVEKFITVEEMQAVLTVLKERQEFFKEIMRKREEFENKTMDKIKELGLNEEKTSDKLLLLANEFAKGMDQKFLNDYKKELDAQQGVIEFLKRFTGEEFVNYSEEFKKGIQVKQ